jgi:hypothetical protein
MTAVPNNRWIRFLRNYGPIPTNDNMYDETIRHALRKYKIEPLVLPAPALDALKENFGSPAPVSIIVTGTAGDGKTYRCREVWLSLGGEEAQWLDGRKQQSLTRYGREIVFIKDLSELLSTESTPLLTDMAEQVALDDPQRIYLVAANHGQLLEKLKLAADNPAVAHMANAVEEMLFRKGAADHGLRLELRDISRERASLLIDHVTNAVVNHPGWEGCTACPIRASGKTCPIWENRSRLQNDDLRTRLRFLIEILAQNGVHLPVRQLLLLVTNALLGHPDARDALMACSDVARIVAAGNEAGGNVYRNIFGENLPPRRAAQTDAFRKLGAFGIGGETSNSLDELLVYGADDPKLKVKYEETVVNDSVYGATPTYARAQQAYLESYDEEARRRFLEMLRAQRQRLFFTLPQRYRADLWHLTVFRHAGRFLQAVLQVHEKKKLDRDIVPLLVRGLNRISTGVLVQNHDELILATSGSVSQSKLSPLLDEMISVPKQHGQEVTLVPIEDFKIAIRVKVSPGGDPGPIELPLTPTRFEFLGRVAEGALPSSFSLECQEDLLAFKAKLLAATARRRQLDDDDAESAGEIALRFIEVSAEGAATPRRVTVSL